jgi:hypothetical protein
MFGSGNTKGGVMKVKTTIGTLVAAGVLVAGVAPTATAAPLEPFTITERVDFSEGGVNTFTATGSLCPSGTFEDSVETFAGHPDTTDQFNLLIRTVYTCADGSGDFYAQKHVFITLTGEDSSTSSGPITFHGGTGDYTSLRGHGVDLGTASGDSGVGEISGVLSLG